MTTITLPRAVVEQVLDAIESDTMLFSAWTEKMIAARTALRAALAQQDEPQDAELSAALGWPGGISDPILDRKTLLRQAADLRVALAQQAEPLINQCGETCERAKLCAVCASKLAEPVQEPYAWMAVGGTVWRHKSSQDDVPLYTAPPQRLPLTDEEIYEIFKHLCNTVGASYKTMTRAVERAHGIKE